MKLSAWPLFENTPFFPGNTLNNRTMPQSEKKIIKPNSILTSFMSISFLTDPDSYKKHTLEINRSKVTGF